MFARLSGDGLSIEVVLRDFISQCHLLAFLASRGEVTVPPEALSGLEDVFKNLALTMRTVQRALTADALNTEIVLGETRDE